MVIEIVGTRAFAGKYDELSKALSSLSGSTEAEFGCTSCQLYREVRDPTVLRVETRWKTEGDLLRHLRSDAYKRFLLLLELGSEGPSIEFCTVSELRGLDLIKMARQQFD